MSIRILHALDSTPSAAPEEFEQRVNQWFAMAGLHPAASNASSALVRFWQCSFCPAMFFVRHIEEERLRIERFQRSNHWRPRHWESDQARKEFLLAQDDCFCKQIPYSLPVQLPTVVLGYTEDRESAIGYPAERPWIAEPPYGGLMPNCDCGSESIAFLNLERKVYIEALLSEEQYPYRFNNWLCHKCLGIDEIDVIAATYWKEATPRHIEEVINAIEGNLALGWLPRKL